LLPGEKTLISLPVITGCLIFSFLLFLILKTFKKNPEISFGLAWFLVALSPNMNIFMPATALLAEHWLYLSLPGFFFALFVLFETISSTWRYRPILLVFLISWIVWIGNHTILRNRDWADSITLFSRTLQESPKSYRANVSLGSVYQKEKQYDKALGYFTRAIAIEPKNPLSYHLRALLYTKMGKNEEALRDHERSVFLDPKNSTSIVFLLKEYSERNENAKIRDILEQQLKNTTDPMAAEKILLSLIHLANAEKNKDLAKKYTELFTKEEMILQNDPMTKIGNFLNKHL
jgi:Tfp pilus assembly protein PilF